MSTKVRAVAAFALTTALTSSAPAQAGSHSHVYDRDSGACAHQVSGTIRRIEAGACTTSGITIGEPILIRLLATS